MSARDEEALRDQLHESNLRAFTEIARRLDGLEVRERIRDAEWNFFRGKQFAYATLFGGVAGAIMHYLLK